jgi:CTP:molybdopterin cytidylyltransferase MocA
MIVLPMVGRSSRFFKAGYQVPKYMLDLHGNPVFDHALGSFAGVFAAEEFLVVCRGDYDTPAFVRERAAALGVPRGHLKIIALDYETAGQAETVAVGLREAEVKDATPLTIFNIDTFRPGFAFPTVFDVNTVDGFLEVFHGEGDHWSFVRPEAGTDRAIEVTEKVRISDLCSDGLYHFRNVDLFMSLYGEIEGQDPTTMQGGEYYVAPLYNKVLARGGDIRYVVIPPASILFCGTPAEYETLVAGPKLSPTGGRA